MAEYTKVFDNPYPSGWEDLPSENTPITASALQEHTDAIENIEQYLEDNPINDSTNVQWNQIEASGTKIAEITIDGTKTNVYAPQGGSGGASSWSDLTNKPFSTIGNELNVVSDKLNYKANYGTSSQFETFKQDTSVPNGATYHVTDDYVGSGDIDTESFNINFNSTYITHWWSDETTFPKQYKWGKVVAISCVVKLASAINQNTWQTIASIPTGFRPENSVYFPIKYADSSYGVTGLVSSSGNIRIVGHNTALSSGSRLVFTVTYIAS